MAVPELLHIGQQRWEAFSRLGTSTPGANHGHWDGEQTGFIPGCSRRLSPSPQVTESRIARGSGVRPEAGFLHKGAGRQAGPTQLRCEPVLAIQFEKRPERVDKEVSEQPEGTEEERKHHQEAAEQAW